MEYKDEDGKILYGYSQTDLQKLITVMWVLALLLALMTGIILYVVWYVISNHVVTNIVNACV